MLFNPPHPGLSSRFESEENSPGVTDPMVTGEQALPGGPARTQECHSQSSEHPILTAPDLLPQLAVADQTVQLLGRLLQPTGEH